MKKPLLISLILIFTSILVFFIANADSELSLEPAPNALSPKISKEIADDLIKKAALSMITTHLEASLKESLASTSINANDFIEFPATCFAPGTDQSVIDDFYKYRTEIRNSLGLSEQTQDSRFNLGSRWGTTAINGGGLGQGDITTLTWSYVPDGTPIGNGGCGVPGESTDNSDFIAFFNGIYGGPTVAGDFTTAPWHNVFISMFDSWSNASGLIFVYEPNDDGVTVVTGGAGIVGTRGDVRISGHELDGNSGVLACNYFPENGDMIIDTADNFYTNNTGNGGNTNVLTHEIGHGLGLFHVCPVNLSKLMEPTVTTAFLGPQEDDILATNRHYGDPEGVNDTSGTASFLGSTANPTSYSVLQRSVDDNADVDYFSFTVSEATVLAATLTPTGTTYLDGVQNNDGSCTAGTPFDALTISDLMVEVLGTDGSTVIATANANGLGQAENLVGVGLSLAGTYFVRVRQQSNINNAQMYDLSVSLAAGVVLDNDVAITTIVEPAAVEVGLTNAEQIVVTLSNFGSVAQSNIPYEVAVDGVVVASETYSPSLNGGASVNVNVPTLVDLSDLGVYNICVRTLLVGDENTANDESCKDVENTICIPTTTNGCDVDGIKQFVLGTINVDDGAAGCNTDPGAPTGYADRTNLVTDLDRRTGSNVHTLQASTRWNDERIKVWIDLNGNNDFTDTGEEVLNQVFTITNGTLESFSITVPLGTSLGTKLLRARAFDASVDPSTTGPCDDIVWGETQDYTVNIVDPTASCAGVTKTWDGSNWAPTGAPDATNTVIISGSFDTATDGGNIEACELTVNTGVTLTVAAGNFINVQNDITVDGTLTVEHQGSVVQVEDDGVVTNNGTINVEVTTPILGGRDFMIMGSPMTGETREDVFAGAFRVRRHLTDQFELNQEVTAQFGDAINFADENLDGTTVNWVNHTGALNPGEGYFVRPQTNGAADATYDYLHNTGTLNTGDVTFTTLIGPDGAGNGSPNIVANPYPSAISATTFMTSNGLGEIYFWEHNSQPNASFPGQYAANFSMGDISMINSAGVGNPAATGGATPTNVLASMQGFGFKAPDADAITFTNAMRTTDNNNTLRNGELNRDIVRLNVMSTNYERGSTTTIAFLAEATAGLDEGMDSKRMANIVSLYTHLEDGSDAFGIQSREAFTDNVKIPVGFSTLIEEETTYRITLADLQGINLTEATPYLIDNFKGTITNLKESDYEFSSSKGRFDGRFTLQFKDENILNTSEVLSEAITIYPNPTNGILNITSPKAPIVSVEVYDMQGRSITNAIVNNQGNYQIDLSRLETAMYFVTINTEQGSITKRVIRK